MDDIFGEICPAKLIISSQNSTKTSAGCTGNLNQLENQTKKLEDRLEAVPPGTSIEGFLINRYVEEQLLPKSFHQRLLGFVYRPGPAHFTFTRQQFLKGQQQLIYTLYPWHRRQCFPESVKVQKIKQEKNEQTWVTSAKHENDHFLTENSLLLGASLYDFEQSLSFFMPV